MNLNSTINNNSTVIFHQNDFDEKFYLSIGSTWIFDSFYLFFILPTAVINVFLNFLTFYILCQVKANQKNKCLFFYLKMYVLNIGISSIFGILMFYSYSPRYFSFALDYFARVLRCHIYTSFLTTMYFFANILDILITFERLSQLILKQTNPLLKISPYLTTLIGLMFCLFVNSPSFLWNYILSDAEFYSQAKDVANLDSFSYCGRTEFIQSNLGGLLSSLMIFVRDIITIILEIVLNIFSVVYYKNFLKKKFRLNLLEMSIIIINQTELSNNQNHNTTNNNSRITLSDMNLFLMILIISFLSLLSHLATGFTTFVFIYYKKHYILAYSVMLTNALVNTIKNGSNFFILFLFNTKFRYIFKQMFK
jgi:hypothetical protein